jgi:protoporphyrinogen oxidase
LVTAILSEPASRALFAESDDTIVKSVLQELDALFPRLSEGLITTRVYRWEYGAVQLGNGAVLRSHALRTALEEQFDDLYIAGDGLHKSSLEISHNTGIKAANHILRKVGAGPVPERGQTTWT